jgi:hypothetical protein
VQRVDLVVEGRGAQVALGVRAEDRDGDADVTLSTAVQVVRFRTEPIRWYSEEPGSAYTQKNPVAGQLAAAALVDAACAGALPITATVVIAYAMARVFNIFAMSMPL